MAGVTIGLTTSDKGVIKKAKKSRFSTETMEIKEELARSNLLNEMQTAKYSVGSVLDFKYLLEREKKANDIASTKSATAVSLTTVALGGANSTKEILEHFIKLIKEYNSSNNTDDDRLAIKKEIQQSIYQIEDNTKVTFDGKVLLDGTLNWNVEYGNDYYNCGNNIINIPSCDFVSLYGANEVDYTDIEKVRKAIDKIDIIITEIETKQEVFKRSQTYFQERTDGVNSLMQSIFYDSNGNEVDSDKALKNIKSNNTAVEIVKLNQKSVANIIWNMSSIHVAVMNAANDVNTQEDCQEYKVMIAEYVKEIDIELTNMEILKKKVFSGDFPYINRITTSLLGLNEISVMNVEEAKASIEKMEQPMQRINDLYLSLDKEIELLETRKNEESDKKLGLEVEINQDLYELNEKYKDKFKVVNGELIYIGTDEDEKEWAKELGLETEIK